VAATHPTRLLAARTAFRGPGTGPSTSPDTDPGAPGNPAGGPAPSGPVRGPTRTSRKPDRPAGVPAVPGQRRHAWRCPGPLPSSQRRRPPKPRRHRALYVVPMPGLLLVQLHSSWRPPSPGRCRGRGPHGLRESLLLMRWPAGTSPATATLSPSPEGRYANRHPSVLPVQAVADSGLRPPR
jgi:hypothetical protein